MEGHFIMHDYEIWYSLHGIHPRGTRERNFVRSERPQYVALPVEFCAIKTMGILPKARTPNDCISVRADGLFNTCGFTTIIPKVTPLFFYNTALESHLVPPLCLVLSTKVNFVAPLAVGGTLLPATKVYSCLLPWGRYWPETGTFSPVLIDFIFEILLFIYFYISKEKRPFKLSFPPIIFLLHLAQKTDTINLQQFIGSSSLWCYYRHETPLSTWHCGKRCFRFPL